MTTQEALQRLRQRLGEAIGEPVEFRGEWSVAVVRERILAACWFLRDECGFSMLTDLSGVDNLGDECRFEVDYLLCSLAHRCHLRLKVHLPEVDPAVDSVAGVWRTADWHEREAYDMYGIRFRGHPDLKRILMWEGYPYHPLRKDFPLAGLPAGLPATAEDAGQAETAPMLGGPFVPGRGQASTIHREPRQYDTAAEQGEKATQPNRQEPV